VTSDQLRKALSHFSTRRLHLDPFDHVLVMGEPMRQFPVDVQQACATALVYITDLEVIKAAFEDQPQGRVFMQALSERRGLYQQVDSLRTQVKRQAQQIDEMNNRLAAARGG